MTRHFPWSMLGIDATSDTAAIRKAYADILRAINIDEDIAGYATLRRARDEALWLAANIARGEEEDDNFGLGDLDDTWDEADDDWDEGPAALHPDPLALMPEPGQAAGPGAELLAGPPEAERRAQEAWQRLVTLLHPTGGPSDEAVTHEEWQDGLVQLRVLTERAVDADLAEYDALDSALAELFASTWPRSAPFVEPANAAFHWLDEAGSLEERPALMFLNQRLKGMRFHEKVQQGDHPLHKAWIELSRPGAATVIDRLRIKRQDVEKLLNGIRARYPELESYLDPQRVSSWGGDPATQGADGRGPRIVRGIVFVLVVLALPRLISQCVDPRSDDTRAPVEQLAQAELGPVETDALLAEIFGEGVGMTDVRAADPVFADQLRLALNRLSYDLMLPIDFVRMKARAAGDVAVGDALMARAELRGIWLDAARRSSVAICDKVIADDFSKLTLDLTPGERQREQVLLRQLLEAGVLGHMPEGGEIRYSIPGWLVSEAITRSGLTEQRLVAALGDRDSPDRCRAEAALTQAVLAIPGRVPTEVLKGL